MTDGADDGRETAGAGASGIDALDEHAPEESFARLGNGIRVAILRALHDHQTGGERGEEPVPYTELRRAVGVDDSGKFGYHVNQLLGEFVEKRPGGYVLLSPGTELVRTIESGAVAAADGVMSAPTDATCYRCGAPVRVTYTGGYVVARCTDCPGALDRDLLPPGALSSIPVPAGAVGDALESAPRELLDRAHGRFCHRARLFGDGICPRCGGETTATVEVCADHDDADGPCETCGVAMPATVRSTCSVCAEGGISPGACLVSHRGAFRDALAAAGVDRLDYDAFATMLGWPASTVEREGAPALSYDLPGRSAPVVVAAEDGRLSLRPQ
ncbi:winged helix-turn-helix domain-containing protein [Halobaculum lipolyticum]|uniref:Winged helix-turn-helix domain-containing protein n=1 Tax=Halobaculum lipolyticum TaxID=3032001 RepID=A0ABD5WFZ5_9EURY|nr:winged helix-turn-helix domain-containing protein [Halobaculum sp. DT31]